jgi:putative phosphoribosyl transferase
VTAESSRVTLPLANRREAGRALADAVAARCGDGDALVLALPRGGVPVAFEIARRLTCELDVMLVRKLGVPGQPELAAGAIASGGVQVLNQDVVDALGLSDRTLAQVAAAEHQELERRERVYRGDRPQPRIEGRCVILVDDGVATGATMRAAIAALRAQNPDRVVIAVPVAAPETAAILEREADELVCLAMPSPFYAIGVWYQDFSQVDDAEVRRLISEAAP